MADHGYVTSDPVLVDLGVKFGRGSLPKGRRNNSWVRCDDNMAEWVVKDDDGDWKVMARLAILEVEVREDRWVFMGFTPGGKRQAEEWHCLHPPTGEDPW